MTEGLGRCRITALTDALGTRVVRNEGSVADFAAGALPAPSPPHRGRIEMSAGGGSERD